MSIHLFDSIADRRAARAAHRRLEREIADFHTPAERLEIEAILSRYSQEDAREIREILVRQAA